jgi:hypothetical protein
MADKAVDAIPEGLSEEKRIAGFTEKRKDSRKDLVRVLVNRGFSFDSIYKTIGIYGAET